MPRVLPAPKTPPDASPRHLVEPHMQHNQHRSVTTDEHDEHDDTMTVSPKGRPPLGARRRPPTFDYFDPAEGHLIYSSWAKHTSSTQAASTQGSSEIGETGGGGTWHMSLRGGDGWEARAALRSSAGQSGAGSQSGRGRCRSGLAQCGAARGLCRSVPPAASSKPLV